MKYSQDDIQSLKEQTDIVRVIENYGIELKKRGAHYQCCCPLHNEKTPSFMVDSAKGTWHCYGCQKHGNAIDFIMEYKHVEFVEAVEELARIMNYQLTEQTPLSREEQAKKERNRALIEVNKAAMQLFKEQMQANQAAKMYVENRWNTESIEHWDIGYAPDDYDWLFRQLTAKGVKMDVLLASDLFKRDKSGKPYSYFRGRVMLPVFNNANEPIAFCGRTLKADDKTKYLNSPNSDIYSKSRDMYGWSFARHEIRRRNEAILVEGNPDVIRLHEIGVTNAVAACGTSLTKEHITNLARHCKNVIMLYDADKAGQAATERNGKLLLAAGLAPYVLTIPEGRDAEGKPAKQDPDSFFTSPEQYNDFAQKSRKNFVYWYVEQKKELYTEPSDIATFQVEVATMLLSLPENEQMAYASGLAAIIPDRRSWDASFREATKRQQKTKKLNEQGYDSKDQEMIDLYGFHEVGNRYLVRKGSGEGYDVEVSNFTMQPLLHIESAVNAKRIFRITNFRGITRDIEISQKDLCSKAAFCNVVESRGNFLFTGKEEDLAKIKLYLYDNTITSKEIVQLGWQPDGEFWAWANGIITKTGQWIPVNEQGIVEYNNQHYYIAACSSTTAQDAQFYQFERRFIHTPSDADLLIWSQKFIDTYGDNAKVGLCYAIAALFRDIAMTKLRSFPLLDIFGQLSTGKTKFVFSLLSLLGDAAEGPNVLTGSKAAIGDHMSKLFNGYVHLDEYKDSIETEKIEMLKGAYENRGRMKMDMDRDKKRMQVPMNCGVILSGQEQTTADSALFSRVIYLTFDRNEFTDEERLIFEDLKEYEQRSLTPITNQIIALRDRVEKGFDDNYHSVRDEMKQLVQTSKFEGRIIENYTIILTYLKCVDKALPLPFNYDDMVPIMVRYMRKQNSEVNRTNEIADFWRGVETLLTNGELDIEYDIRIRRGKTNFKCTKGSGIDRIEIDYTGPYNVLYLNPKRVFSEYEKMCKSRNKKALPEGTLRYYLKAKDDFMGDYPTTFTVPRRNREFSGAGERPSVMKTRAYMFNYDRLQEAYGIDLDIIPSGMMELQPNTNE